ncbi:type II secretion system protein GspC [Deferrisoma palaeochoriense]
MREALLRHRWVLTVGFLVVAAHLSAKIAGLWVARSLWSPESGRPTVSVTAAEAERRERLADYRIIEDRNLFNAHPTPEPAATPAPAPAARATPEPAPTRPLPPLNLTLLGTVVVEGAPSFAVIQDGAEVKVVREGAEVAEGATLVQVLSDRVRIRRGGSEEEILLFQPKAQARADRSRRPPPSQPASEPETPASDDTVQKVAEDKWVIDAREIEQAQENMSQLLTQIRVVPNFTDGQPDGFKVFAIRPGSLFAKIGLQNGDVIKRINGIEIQGPEQAFEAYQRLKDETTIQIDLVRRNQNQTFTYEIR